VKRTICSSLYALLLVVLALSLSVVAQNRRPDSSSTGGAKVGAPPPGAANPARKNGNLKPSGNPTEEIEGDFSQALSIIEDNYIDGKKLDYNNVFKSSIIGMLRTLDPHSNYYDREEFDELKTDQRSEYFGIGASIQNQTIGGQTDTYITATFEDSPAAKAGLRYGDKIVAVDGTDMRGKFSSEVRDKIRGPRGSVVKMSIEHAATGRTDTVDITRDVVPQPSIPDAYMIRPGVGYIDMTHGFNFTTADELQKAIEFLHKQGMTSLVLDLRNNPGGFLDQAIRVSEMFLKQGQLILTQRGRTGYNEKNYRSTNANPDTTPLVILVNGNTASASEIVSGAMQDHDRALIVGQTTFGKGLVQGIFQLEYGTGLTLTTAKYYTPSGRLIQRDYSNESFYDYYTKGGLGSQDSKTPKPILPSGPESHTDSGRSVFGGGGISPDEAIKPRIISQVQARLLNPLFFFARDLATSKISGYDAYKVNGPINFDHRVQATDFPSSEQLFQAFKQYALKDPSWNVNSALIDRNRDFINIQLRFNLAMAAYGRVTADQVLVADDPQVAKAMDMVPRARELAQSFRERRQP
jgi:carboxyl-terminal processing protease